MLATAGWGTSTGTLLNLELAPYGASFGVDLGYTWAVGFRLGAHLTNSLGQGVRQHRDPRIGREYDFTANASSVSGGLSIGWDVPLYSFVLRYSLSLGVTSMHWDFQEVPENAVRFDANNPSVGFHVGPGVALLWPYRWFEAGVGFDYLAQIKDTIPSGVVGKLLIGVRP